MKRTGITCNWLIAVRERAGHPSPEPDARSGIASTVEKAVESTACGGTSGSGFHTSASDVSAEYWNLIPSEVMMTVAFSRSARAHIYQGVECYSESLRTPLHNDVTMLTISGEIDASNVGEFDGGLKGCLATKRPVIVDLSRVPFLGVQGMRTLREFDDGRRSVGAAWILVTCPTLCRLFDIVFGDHRLPIARSIGDALQQLHRSAGQEAAGAATR